MRGGGEDEAVLLATKQLMVQRWSILWRSIVASALDTTLFPYCRYIKLLDFRDLRYLLEDDQFKGKVMKFVLPLASLLPPTLMWIREFFSGPMARFHMTRKLRQPGNKGPRLDESAILDAIGDGNCSPGPQKLLA